MYRPASLGRYDTFNHFDSCECNCTDTLLTKETSCPQVINTTEMAQEIAQVMILQQINNNITTLIDMVDDNTQLLDGYIVSSKQSQQLVNNNITTLINTVGDCRDLRQ